MIRQLGMLLGMLLAGAVQASMVLDRAIVEFASGGPPREDVTVFNPGDEPLFIEVQVLNVLLPGTPEEQRVVVRDPESIGFIATPTRLTVPPGARRRVRLVNLEGHGEQERVYRVNLRPVPPPVESDTMAVRVMVGYQLLVFIKPERQRVDLDARRDGHTLHLHNRGNVNIRLTEGWQCPPGVSRGREGCEAVRGRRLYPGNQVELSLPLDRPASFRVEAAGNRSWQTFN
jgi:P pilus assembly chaperone PapD